MSFFRDSKEPLYGRADSIMKLAPFTTSVLKEIMSDHKPDYTKDDLLGLYTFTGGVPKYIEQFMDNGCTDVESMVDFMLQPDSSFLTEGQALLVQEFGKKYGNYFSIRNFQWQEYFVGDGYGYGRDQSGRTTEKIGRRLWAGKEETADIFKREFSNSPL